MYLLMQDKQRGTDAFYKGMIANVVVEISQSIADAKLFETAEQANDEKNRYDIFLRGFMIYDIDKFTINPKKEGE